MKILKSIGWFFWHPADRYEFNKLELTHLKYYEYELYEFYNVLLFISFKRLIHKFQGPQSLTYHNLVHKLKSHHQETGEYIMDENLTLN